MKQMYHLITICLFVLALLFWVDSTTKYKDFTQTIETELMIKDLRIQQLEKEIRIMRTDLDIMENGFEK